MFITRETDYAIRCALHLATLKGGVASVADIALESEISKAFAAKILQRLVKAGIVESARGVKGGFSLTKDPSKTSLFEVIAAIQGEPGLNICVVEGLEDECDRSGYCPVHPVWKELQADMLRKLSGYSLKRLSGNSAGGVGRRRK